MATSSRVPVPTFGTRTDVGIVRDHNEDSLIVKPPLYVVCDGMGGHAAGEVASEIAAKVVAERAPDHADAQALGQAVEEANIAVIRAALEGAGREGMGTTCTAAILEGERLVLAQVGDSRAYLLHQGSLQQITRDHSLMADLIESGKITEEEARYHPQRSVITRALGSDPSMKPDLFELNVDAGDRLLLCSDGLSSMVTNAQIQSTLCRVRDPQACASQLVNEAIEAGGYDNITVIVVDVEGFQEVRQKRVARKTKVTAGIILVLLAAILVGAGYLYSFMNSSSAYLIAQDGYVAIYKGLQGDVLGLSSSELVRVTNVAVDDLQPGLANRLETEGIHTDSVEAAEALVAEYADEINQRQQAALATRGTSTSSTLDRMTTDNTAAETETDNEQPATGATR